MRVTADVKEKTRARILASARKLFSSKGFDETTTRDIASRSRIATGTLFNYFISKEALGMTMVADALNAGRDEFQQSSREDQSLVELLFSHVMSGLRALVPCRPFIAAVLDSALSPFNSGSNGQVGDNVRVRHLETVAELISQHKIVVQPSFVAMHLYWTLYLGVLAFWAGDESPNQEDTLVVLDQSLQLFVKSLSANSQVKEVSSGA